MCRSILESALPGSAFRCPFVNSSPCPFSFIFPLPPLDRGGSLREVCSYTFSPYPRRTASGFYLPGVPFPLPCVSYSRAGFFPFTSGPFSSFRFGRKSKPTLENHSPSEISLTSSNPTVSFVNFLIRFVDALTCNSPSSFSFSPPLEEYLNAFRESYVLIDRSVFLFYCPLFFLFPQGCLLISCKGRSPLTLFHLDGLLLLPESIPVFVYEDLDFFFSPPTLLTQDPPLAVFLLPQQFPLNPPMIAPVEPVMPTDPFVTCQPPVRASAFSPHREIRRSGCCPFNACFRLVKFCAAPPLPIDTPTAVYSWGWSPRGRFPHSRSGTDQSKFFPSLAPIDFMSCARRRFPLRFLSLYLKERSSRLKAAPFFPGRPFFFA